MYFLLQHGAFSGQAIRPFCLCSPHYSDDVLLPCSLVRDHHVLLLETVN
jgi:hypothetical protein